jgi:hypothetical protein
MAPDVLRSASTGALRPYVVTDCFAATGRPSLICVHCSAPSRDRYQTVGRVPKSTTIAKDKHEFVFPIIKVDTLIIGMQLGVGRVKAVHNN